MYPQLTEIDFEQPVRNRTRLRTIYLVFLVWPFLAVINALRNFRQPYAKNIIWLFITFYGATMVFVSDALDGARIISSFNAASQSGFNLVDNYFIEGGYLDILQPFLLYAVSKVTHDTRILFACMGFIFGFFYSRNLWFLIGITKDRDRRVLIFIFLFSLIIPFWEINGFRMWTAAHILFYGISRYLYYGDKKFLFISLLSPLVHFSFFFAVVVILLFLLFRPSIKLSFLIFLIACVIQELNLDIRALQSFFPAALQSKFEGYGNIEWAESVRKMHETMHWYAKLYNPVIEYLLDSIMLLIFIFSRKIEFKNIDRNQSSFISFSLWFAAFSRLLSAMPFGDNYRFVIISNLFLTATIIILFTVRLRELNLKNLYFITLIFIGFYSIVQIRIGFDRIGISTFMTNPLTLWFFEDSKPLIVFIKGLFG